jgi:hypothetical protein
LCHIFRLPNLYTETAKSQLNEMSKNSEWDSGRLRL